MFKKKPTFMQRLDMPLLIGVLLLCALGLVVIRSATLTTGSISLIRSQVIATIIGFILVIIIYLLNFKVWLKLSWIIYVVSNALLVITLILGIGHDEWGARSWLGIGSFVFQPSEFVKIGFIIFVANYIEKNKDTINEPVTLLKLFLFAGLPIGLIALQPDFGTAMVFISILAVMLLISGLSWRYIFPVIGVGLISLPILGPLLWKKLDTYQQNRILDWINPSRAVSSTGYQFQEGRIAIGSGQLTGRGLFKGTQTQFNYIPAKHNDYIFTVLVEELGFIGGAFLIGLYALVFYRMYIIAEESRAFSAKLMIVGFASLFIIHIWENIGMTMGLMPITGIPLPFMSHGGTFQIANLICIGIMLNISKYNVTGRY
ncbi:MAG: rod shape-determining protein RodA [Tissierellia bacterium]|nr:rod shape-determining protein RodA [Tissierellia bacterium]